MNPPENFRASQQLKKNHHESFSTLYFRSRYILVPIFVLMLLAPTWSTHARPVGTLKVGLISFPFSYTHYLVIEPLVVADNDRIKPVLAESWQWIDDKTLEMNLRTGVRFHDGSPFNASAVKANFNFFKQWHFIKPLRDYFSDTHCEIIDAHRIRFELPKSDGLFLFMLSTIFQISPARLNKAEGKPAFAGTIPTPGDWGTGPFRISAGFENQDTWSAKINLTAFEDYWDSDYPKVQQIVLYDLDRHFGWPAFQVMNCGNRIVMESEGRLDIAPAIPFATLDIVGSRCAKIAKTGWSKCFGLINMRKKDSVWQDIRLRRALNLAIDRSLIYEKMKGNARFLPGLISIGCPGHHPDLKPYKHALRQARELIRDAGFDRKLTIKILIPSIKYELIHSMDTMLGHAGFKPEFVVLSIEELLQKLKVDTMDGPTEEQDWDVCLTKLQDVVHHPYFDIYKSFFDKQSDFRWIDTDDELQNLIDCAGREMDEVRHNMLLRQCEALVHRKAYVLDLFFLTNSFAVNKNIMVPDGLDDERFFLKEISLAPGHWSLKPEKKLIGAKLNHTKK